MTSLTDVGHVDAAYLWTVATAEPVRHAKRRSYERMDLKPGHRVLDVGCGPATDTMALAGLVGGSGRVDGVDHDPDMIAEANHRCAAAGCTSWVFHHEADAQALPFATHTFDASRSERLFQHLDDPRGVLQDMIRVTKPGCSVVVLDTDWESVSIDTDDVEIEHILARARRGHVVKNPHAGRQLYRLFRQCGLSNITIDILPAHTTSYRGARYAASLDRVERAALAAGLIAEDALKRWHHSCEQADAEGVFFAHMNLVLAAGRTPQ